MVSDVPSVVDSPPSCPVKSASSYVFDFILLDGVAASALCQCRPHGTCAIVRIRGRTRARNSVVWHTRILPLYVDLARGTTRGHLNCVRLAGHLLCREVRCG